jgi:hypothetical protein
VAKVDSSHFSFVKKEIMAYGIVAPVYGVGWGG